MPKRINPILDERIPNRCSTCGRDGYPYFGNVPPAVIMNYLLKEHAAYLLSAVIKNIEYLNNVNDGSEHTGLQTKELRTARAEDG
jgi:hypothetical protein